MRNQSRNRRGKERRMEYKKRTRLAGRILLFAIIMALVLLSVAVRNVKAEMEQIQAMLKRIENLQRENAETESEGETGEKTEEIDYVSSIDTIPVEAPAYRTREEAMQRLEKLGQSNPVIEKIYNNSSFYPESMLIALANNPEMADFAEGYLEGGEAAAGGLTGLTSREKELDYPLLLQWDPRWGYQTYGKNSFIGLSGCGPTSLAMVLYYLTGDETLTPDKIAAYAMKHDYYVEGTGTSWALMKDIPAMYGITVTEPQKSEWAFKKELDQGNILICAMGSGDFTLAGHFIVLYGYEDNGFMVNDSNCVARSRKRWAFHEIEGQIKKIWAYEKRV